LSVRGKPSVDLLRVVNREGVDEDRVIVRVRLRVHCSKPRLGLLGVRRAHLDERWTFGRDDARWVLLSVDGDPLAGPILTSQLIPDRSFDTDRLLEESLAELADAQKVGNEVALSALVGADEPPALAVLDLSVVDGRFLPPLIAAQLTHLVEAWEEATTGSQRPLSALASDSATTALIRPGPDVRLIMRDAVLKSWQPTKLHLSRQPPAIEVTLDVEAFRYVTTDDGREQFGNDSERRRIAMTWALELTDSARTPWRLAASSNPAEAIPGWS